MRRSDRLTVRTVRTGNNRVDSSWWNGSGCLREIVCYSESFLGI